MKLIQKIIHSLCMIAVSIPLSSQAIVLGGVTVPKEKIIVYLLIGHSNMVGQDRPHADGVTNPHVWNYQWNTTKTWVLAKEPPNSPTLGLSGHGCGGPGMPFLKGMVAAHPDYYLGVVSNASQSATCRGENTGSNSSGIDATDNRYWKGTFLYNQIITAANEIHKDVTLGGILCMLGTVEATRTSETVCNAFSSDIAQLATDLRKDLNEPNLPFIMGEYETGATGAFAITQIMPGIVAAETKRIPSKLPLSITVDSKGIEMLDDHHYTASEKGQTEWAKRAIAGIQEKAWFPPPVGKTEIIGFNLRKKSNQLLEIRLLKGRNRTLIYNGGQLFLVNGNIVTQ